MGVGSKLLIKTDGLGLAPDLMQVLRLVLGREDLGLAITIHHGDNNLSDIVSFFIEYGSHSIRSTYHNLLWSSNDTFYSNK